MKKVTYKGIYSRKATMAFRKIFGNVVDKVFVSAESWYSKEYIERAKNTSKANWSGELIDWSGNTLVVHFTNGKIVRMSNSEWATFERVLNFEEFKDE